MLGSLNNFLKLINNDKIIMHNKRLDNLVHKFKGYIVFKDFETSDIQERKNESKIIIIDVINETNGPYFVVVYDYTILFLTNISLLSNLIKDFETSTIYTIYLDTKSHLPNEFQKKIHEYVDSDYQVYLKTIENFSDKFRIKSTGYQGVDNIWKLVQPSFSSYFINKSYQKLEKERMNLNYIEITEFDFIELQVLGNGSSAKVQLVFDIEKEQLFAKKVYSYLSNDNEKSLRHETFSYRNICHPSFPHFYGEMKERGGGLIIEYIRGRTLDKIELEKIPHEEKMYMILQLMIIIEYLQYHQFVYRDLKPNNIIYNENRQIILLDFDQMVNLRELGANYPITANIGSHFMCPEMLNGEIKEYSFREDVYSIGVLIYYIIFKEIPKRGRKDKSNENNYSFDKLLEYGMKEVCEECTETDCKNRPIITKLIDYFFDNFCYMKGRQTPRDQKNNINECKLFPEWKHNEEYFEIFIKPEQKETYEYYIQETNKIHYFYQFDLSLKYYQEKYFLENISKFISYLSKLSENPKSQFYLGIIYIEKVFGILEINKSIYYLTLAANQNHPDAQNILGIIYCSGKYITRDINKSIHYFTLSANQNHSNSQYHLGAIYYYGDYITRDIDKAIYYLTLAANQNNPDAQNILGSIYYSDIYTKQDINKSIYYLTLAANQNNPEAQYKLGAIYGPGRFITQDINKSIYYLTLAANQNHPISQFYLGLIYYTGDYNTRDINKSIHYLTLAANHNNPDAQNILGIIYYTSKYITQDIHKSIHYLTLSANQNHPDSQYQLGVIYYTSKYITQDVNKSIHYLTLAANQNHPGALNKLGAIYYTGEYITRDINKSIHYLTLASNSNYSDAQFHLGVIYYENKYITQDINKSIHYLTLAANQNHPDAQFYLGFFYLKGKYLPKDFNKATYYLYLSANQGNHDSQFILGVIYSKGEYFKQDMEKAIHYYKEASSFNIAYAKNNLAMIYRNGIHTQKRIGYSIELLKESVRLNDPVSMYNLSHIYFYEPNVGMKGYDEIIDLLIKSIYLKFMPSINLLVIVIIKKYQTITKEKIQHEIESHETVSPVITNELAIRIYNYIKSRNLEISRYYEAEFEQYRNLDCMYNYDFTYIATNLLMTPKKEEVIKGQKINELFYEGFGISLDPIKQPLIHEHLQNE